MSFACSNRKSNQKRKKNFNTTEYTVPVELLEPSIQENCISYANPSDKIIRNQTFCCCASNLCNQNIYFTSKRNPFVEHKTEQSHIPKPNIRPKIQNRTAKYSFLTPGELNAILITSLVFLFLFALAFAIFWVFRKKLFFLKNHKYNLPTVFFSQQNSQVNSSSPSFRPNNHQEPRSIELHNPGLAINHTKDEMINEYLNFNNKIKQNNPLINTEELKSLTQPLLGESQGVFPSALVAPNIDIPENLFRHSNQMKPSFNFPDLVIRNDLKELEDVKASLEKQLLGKENFKDSNPELLNAILNPRQLQTSDIYLIEKISQGQFSSVWKARCLNSKNDNSPEAPEYGVKVFSGNQKSAWTNEKDIYNSLSTTNPNILKYFCSDIHELTKSEQQQNSFFPFCTNEYWIITEYHPNGSLYDYLKVNELSWQQMVKIANSILEGLAYLHSENAENRKPFAIAHRDLKSKNILVKNDGQSCCIADFGLALKLTSNNKLNSAEIRSKVGTRRYMSPELIEGAIAFTKETFLRIDVYACALVLWEVISRGDFYEEKSEYKLPFEDEIGQNPSLEDMKEIVVDKSVRPIIKRSWLNHYQIDSIAQTIEECWDVDLDARISSECAASRIRKIYNNYISTSVSS